MMAMSLQQTPAFADAVDRLTHQLIQGFYVDQQVLMQKVAAEEQAQQAKHSHPAPDVMTAWENRQKQQDAIFENYDSKAVRGVQDRTNPFTNSVEQTPDNYSHVWVNSLGDHLYSNSASFNPNGSPVDWRDEPAAN